MRVLLVGCGYVGMAAGRRLVAAGHRVTALRRDAASAADLAALGMDTVTADVTRPESLARVAGPFDWVVNTVSSTRGGAEVYREVFLEGTRNLLERMHAWPVVKYVYTSSTSVYGQTDGSWVDESSEVTPSGDTARWLVATERLLQEASATGFPAVILRVAGIYGPGRGHLFQQFLRGEARMVGDGSRWINMVHRDDVAGAIGAALLRGKPGAVYNVADDESVTQRAFFEWLAARLGRPLPPVADAATGGSRKRRATHKRVQNTRLREALGWRPEWPTFREGYGPLIEAVLSGAPGSDTAQRGPD